MGTSSIASSRALARTARRQFGCFTASQAVEAGYRHPLHVYHVARGDWVKLARGLYRLASEKDTPEARLMLALLWPRNKAGAVDCALAGDAAQAVREGRAATYEGPVALAVPKSFRFRSTPPEGVEILSLASDSVPSTAVGPFRVLEEGKIAEEPSTPSKKAPRKAKKTRKTAQKRLQPAPEAPKAAPKAEKLTKKAKNAVVPPVWKPAKGFATGERADAYDEWDYRSVVEEIRALLPR
jgi:hypothetical protein